MFTKFRTVIAASLAASILLAACGGSTPAPTEEVTPAATHELNPDGAGDATPEQPIVGAPTFGEAVIDTIDIQLLESSPVQVHAVLTGNLPDGCTKIDTITQSYDAASKTFTLKVATRKPGGVLCTEALVPYEQTVALDGVVGLAKGTYTVNANGKTTTFELTADN